MVQETAFVNGRIVTADKVFQGSLVVRDGTIAAIDPGLSWSSGPSPSPGTVDLAGDSLLPGLIEIHTDNVERHMAPRPGVLWPAVPALLAHDAEIAAAGITTVFDALAVGAYEGNSIRRDLLPLTLGALGEVHGLLRAEHFVHLRLELADPAVLDIYDRYGGDERVRLFSLMDHSPGQRQWNDLDRYRRHYTTKRGLSEAEVVRRIADAERVREAYSRPNRRALLERLRGRRLPVASHDDTTEDHVREARADGIAISEFPTTLEAAEAAHACGLAIVMGAPNLVRGQSHSGNVSASALAALRRLDILSSDYVPASLLAAVHSLRSQAGWSLPRAVATASATPARLLGLPDRGDLAVGKRADLLRVAETPHGLVVRGTWRAGQRVA